MSGSSSGKGGADELFAVFRRSLSRHAMVRENDTVVVGVSGGMDSMCLLDLLSRVREQAGIRLVVAHLHHGLRGEEADRDYRFVEEQASRYGFPFEGLRVRPDSYPGKANLQARARDLRYAFYEEAAERHGAQKIATGHHRDDQVETLLMQLFRGTGTFRGILPVRDGRYIRPLLELGRQGLLGYASSRGVPYVEDSTNRKRAYLRNRIRHDFTPWIRKEINPSFDRALTRLADILSDEADCMDALARRGLNQALKSVSPKGDVTLRRKHLEELEPALRKRVIRLAYERIHGSTSGLSFARVQEICRCMEPPAGGAQRRFHLQGGIHLFLEYEEVLLSRRDLWVCPLYRYPLSLDEVLAVPEAGAEIQARLVPRGPVTSEALQDRDQAFLAWGPGPREMAVRNVRPGDRFRPMGAGGGKKLKDFFIDRKVPRSVRSRIPLLEIDGVVAWVAGWRMDDRFRIPENAPDCLHIRIQWQGEPDSPMA